ncbi:hypothetical protein CARUB_v10027906mg [Capsella rubella]|uniref:BHLH domain-containing protein n=1 Tax=Capsella rubella TaxID=81985 RepID=R0GK61_9BRAS|nr:transcription factor SAC51 [Capsella rubella]XP_023635104.1 transcription factor SAC51 [Capsella rubella]EOA12685.1 hypothetical protein CARUB_v10027906mg [Capsella rubella]
MPLDMRQRDLPLGLSPTCFEDIAGQSVHPGIPLPELGKLYAAELQARCLQPPPFQSLLCSQDKESCGNRFSLSEMRSWCAVAAATTTPHGALESSQKRLVIFDQIGNQTRLMHCPFPLRFPSHKAVEPVKLSELHSLEKAVSGDNEEFGENHSNGKESEMHEDTEEINALLYSDDDYDDDCESDDEVMSTGHSPYLCNKRKLDEFDGPCKRQKLLNKDNKISESSSLVGTKSSTKLYGSSFLKDKNISTKEETGSGISNEQSKKDKIRTALKILESIVPGAKGNEALLLLDEAIDYLKLLKRDLISTEVKNQTSTTHKSPILLVKETTWGTRNLQTDKA